MVLFHYSQLDFWKCLKAPKKVTRSVEFEFERNLRELEVGLVLKLEFELEAELELEHKLELELLRDARRALEL